MFRAPWMIEVKRGGDDSDRLFGNTIALCGVHLMPVDMWLLTGWRREGSREFFTTGTWPVTWGTDDLGAQGRFYWCSKLKVSSQA